MDNILMWRVPFEEENAGMFLVTSVFIRGKPIMSELGKARMPLPNKTLRLYF